VQQILNLFFCLSGVTKSNLRRRGRIHGHGAIEITKEEDITMIPHYSTYCQHLKTNISKPRWKQASIVYKNNWFESIFGDFLVFCNKRLVIVWKVIKLRKLASLVKASFFVLVIKVEHHCPLFFHNVNRNFRMLMLLLLLLLQQM